MQACVLTEFDPSVYRRFGLPTAEHLLVLRVDETYWESLHKKLKEHVEKNDKRIMSGMEPFKLEVKIGVDYRHRSLSANAWLWAMHTIEADIINGKKLSTRWHGIDDVTPEMVHDDYMERLAPRAEVVVDEWMAQALSETAKIVAKETLPDGKVKLSLMKTSSYMNAREFAQLSHEVESQMIGYGIPLDNYLEYKKLADQVPEFDRDADMKDMTTLNGNVLFVGTDGRGKPFTSVGKRWEAMTREEQKRADPERYDREINLELF